MGILTSIIGKTYFNDDYIKNFSNYSNTIESHFHTFQQEYEQHFSQLKGEDLSEYADIYFDDYVDSKYTYPDIHRKSLFISIWSCIEFQLIKLSKEMKQITNNNLSLNDLTGSGIEKAQKYLKIVIGINFPDTNNTWKTLKDYNKIRNCLVHNHSQIDEYNNPDKLKNAIKTIPGIKWDSHNFIQIEKEFINNFLSVVKSFLDEIITECNNFLNRHLQKIINLKDEINSL